MYSSGDLHGAQTQCTKLHRIHDELARDYALKHFSTGQIGTCVGTWARVCGFQSKSAKQWNGHTGIIQREIEGNRLCLKLDRPLNGISELSVKYENIQDPLDKLRELERAIINQEEQMKRLRTSLIAKSHNLLDKVYLLPRALFFLHSYFQRSDFWLIYFDTGMGIVQFRRLAWCTNAVHEIAQDS